VKILVTFALENEFAPWRAMRRFRPRQLGEASVFASEIGEAEVAVLLTGVGTHRAETEISKVSWGDSSSLELCISAGLAGALRPAFEIGQVLAAQSVISNVVSLDGSGRAIDCSAPLVSFAAECGATVVERFCTSDRVISCAEEKRHMGRTAEAVEMESFGILRAASRDGIPAAAIRSVSDTAEEDLPLDMGNVFTEDGRVSVVRVLGQLALRPTALPRLVKLGNQSRRAAESLARFLDQYVGVVAGRVHTLESKVQVAANF
jgi:adenosylhomocysteine nucleosidase